MMAPLALSTNSQCRAERIDDDLDVRSQLSLEIFFLECVFVVRDGSSSSRKEIFLFRASGEKFSKEKAVPGGLT